MDDRNTHRAVPSVVARASVVVAVIAAALVFLGADTRPALAADGDLSEADQQCLKCHRFANLDKTLENGETLSLHVVGDEFAQSVHRVVGCAGCHADIDPDTHWRPGKAIDSLRSYAISATETCRRCHADMFDQWESSIHAAMVRAGSPAAPICTDCHSPHAVIKDAAMQLGQLPCKNCHQEIYTAYLGSMHAKALRRSDQSPAPLCANCHSAHNVQPTVLGEGPTAACSGCHTDALEAHQRWLPNAALHFEVASCPVCHSPTAERKVDLLLVDSEDQAVRGERIGVPLLEASARSNGQGLDAETLWNLLQTFNREDAGSRTLLRGRLEVRTPAQAHQLADKSMALSDCETCHRAGSEAFQSVTITLAGPDGRRVRYGADADVLSSVISLDSVSGFYAIGGTRIRFLDITLILAFLGGLAVPVGHMTMGWIFRRYFLEQAQASASGDRPPGGDDHVAA